MHASSLINMQKCYERYACRHEWNSKDPIDVVDIGGANVNGSYADIFHGPQFNYRAADLYEDDNVDIVLEEPYKLPFDDGSLDIIISGQAFEHVEFFWLLFEEMVRVLSPNGFIFLIAPSGGPIHQYPVDCYRYYPDAYRALAKYTNCNLVEVWHDDLGPWNDLIGIFSKGSIAAYTPETAKPKIDWPPSRYETEINPTVNFPMSVDLSEELIQGTDNYLDVMQRLHEKLAPKSYLEIGVRRGRSLALARCRSIGVDPMPDINVALNDQTEIFETTSDDFFEFYAGAIYNGEQVDFAFIDGMHLFEYALRDFINIERIATSDSVVIMDDVLPNHPKQAQRHRATAVWTGDVWKMHELLAKHRPDLSLTLLDTNPTGLLVITNLDPGNRELSRRYNPIVRQYKALEFEGNVAERILKRVDAAPPPSGSELAELLGNRKE